MDGADEGDAMDERKVAEGEADDARPEVVTALNYRP